MLDIENYFPHRQTERQKTFRHKALYFNQVEFLKQCADDAIFFDKCGQAKIRNTAQQSLKGLVRATQDLGVVQKPACKNLHDHLTRKMFSISLSLTLKIKAQLKRLLVD